MKALIKLLLVSILIGMSTGCYAKRYQRSYGNVAEEDGCQYRNTVTITYSSKKCSVLTLEEINYISKSILIEMDSVYPFQHWNKYDLGEFKRRIFEKVIEKFPDIKFRIIKVKRITTISPMVIEYKEYD